MIAVAKTCAKCGATIFAEAPQEFCSACLLETGLGLLAEEVQTSNAQRPTSNAELRGKERAPKSAWMITDFGDYELMEEIGRGGQGVVYRARQKSLNRTVALKVIGLGQWATEAHVKRFRREAEAAAKLDHPGIVPIHEVGERDGCCYFSMNFVAGGQLDQVVRDSPMSPRQAAELIAKVARTVHYAHEHGILHRDIKPGNILLDQKGEPHLTDFGLARLVETESTVTRTKEALGTPSYMAPEQAVGETSKLTSATDVYGLGAVLYQLLTGQPPFAGGTTYETIRLLLDKEPRPPRLLNPKIDRDLSTICLKCLEKDPQRRYSSALALAEDLEHWLKHEPIHAKPSGFVIHTRKWVRRNPSTTVLVTLLVALALGLSITVWKRPPKVVIPKSVAVLPFQNLVRDPDKGYLPDGIQEEILTRLAGIAGLKVISRTSTQRYQSKPRNLAQIAKELGVANILEGSVQKTGEQLRVSVQLINAQTDADLWADTYDRKLTDIFGVESEIAKRIAESLQTKLTTYEERALAVKPTNNSEAYDAYLRGVAFAAGGYSADALPKIIDSYELAVKLDPNFALAWARLSRANSYLCFRGDVLPVPAGGTAVARRDAATKALENAQKLQPNLPETVLALGYYQYWVLGDYGLAKTTFGRVSKMLPTSSEVPYALGLVNRREGHWDETIAHLEQALALDPRNPDVLGDTAKTYAMLRQFPAALKLVDRALDILPDDTDLVSAKARIYQAQGNLQEAAKLLVDVNAHAPSEAMFAAKIGQLTLERNFSEAVGLLQARLTEFKFGPEKTGYQLWLAILQRFAGDTAGGKASAEEALKMFESFYQRQPENPDIVHALSVAKAELGEKDSALKDAKRAIALLPSGKISMEGRMFEENLARIHSLFSENGRAISILTRLLQMPGTSSYYPVPVTPALLKLDPIWDPLRDDPAFRKLCEQKIDKSIAVLPFENLSRDPDNAYFAEGMQEEILTRLARIADLKVISRTSTLRYQSKPPDLDEIAKQLGVANVLEGSVQRIADQVRVNVQLINTQSDSHLWADTYDRKSTDIFAVESEIAKRIAESLQAKLSGYEEQALAVKPTNNPEAYEAYLRGLAAEARSSAPWEAASFYERAVQLDPNFAVAWARLSRVHADIYSDERDTTPGRREAAKRAWENAQKLAADSPEAMLALGYYQYRVLHDFGAAKTTFGRVSRILPGNSEVPYAVAEVTRREGHWDQSIAHYEQALALDPRNVELLREAALTYSAVRQFPVALKLYDRVQDITPNDPEALAGKASIYQAHGNLQEAARLLSGIDWQTHNEDIIDIKINQLRLERKFGEVIRLLQTRQAQFQFASESEKAREWVGLAFMQRLAGDMAGAKATAEQAHNMLQSVCNNQPNNAFAWAALAQANALIGERDLALQQTARSMVLLQSANDAVLGPPLEEWVAVLQIILGETSRPISTLSRLLQTPGIWTYGAPLTPALLRLDPIWDPLRGDPAFEKLCQEKQP